jgi:16S rRNA processing protein RimM
MPEDDWVLLARLIRPQGRKGEIVADIFTDFPDRFRDRPRVCLLDPKKPAAQSRAAVREALIEDHWLHQGRVVLKFKGIDSINDAETLRGLEVVVPAAERIPLTDDSVYIGDLVGCQLVDLAGTHGRAAAQAVGVIVGQVIDVQRCIPPAADLLVVRPGTAIEPGQNGTAEPLLVPFAKAYLVSVDLAAKRIAMRLPGGLTDLNAPLSPDDEIEDDNIEDDDIEADAV